MKVNCNRNKTECLIIRPPKSSELPNPPKLTINGEEIDYVHNSKVLGLTIDDKLLFDKHARKKLQQCWYTWYRISKNTTRHRGLNISSLTILFKSIVLSKLLYAAPVWLKSNLSTFKSFYARVCLKISGSTHYPLQNLALIAMGLEPLSLLYNVVSTKFTLKALYSDHDMRSMILQLEDSRGHPFHHHTVMVKQFLKLTSTELNFTRNSEVNSLEKVEKCALRYTEADIEKYKTQLWLDLLKSQSNTELDTNSLHLNSIEGRDLEIKNHKYLFPRSSKRVTDTKVMTLIHGHSLMFNKFQYSLGETYSPNCSTCLVIDDNYHRLLECPKYECIYRKSLKLIGNLHCTILELILQGNKIEIKHFRYIAQIIFNGHNI